MREELQQLIERFVGKEAFSSETALNKKLHIEGDDAEDLLVAFSEAFEVDISNFPFDDYFYSESKVPYLWFIKFLGLGKEKKPFYIYQLETAIKIKRLLWEHFYFAYF